MRVDTQRVPGLPERTIFLVLVAGKAGNEHQKRKILGELAALQTSLRGRIASVV
jgi:hypothetical protein